MEKLLFIDRDGTIILEPEDEQIDSLEKLEFFPGAITGLQRLAASGQFSLIMVSNQDGLGTDSFPEDTFWPAHTKMLKTLNGEGVHFSSIHIDPSLPAENSRNRKPNTGMLESYLENGFDKSSSYVIGDRLSDVMLAKNMGCKAILINDGSMKPQLETDGLMEICSLITTSWQEITSFLLSPSRKAFVKRTTNETDIEISLNLDGTGKSSISTGLGFFDHMLDQLARHGSVDLNISVKGDLHIDEHHTIEDTALALGSCFEKALGDKRGIQRYGFLLPMDDCLAQVAIDFGGRPWLEWDAEFKREKIGEMPTEMFMHFFKSFSDTSRCNLNIRAEGNNEHHKIEAIFKGFAKAIKMAIRKDPESMQLPSTKGVL
ncbi:bifunctional histidinol-phosphatase/imidazoleglycerol-phosphate dehydratase HisB [Fulvivirga sedimenti]|uniref:Histidine biosynthesis bifunctional protein HisB n=1 Tax=Fulvivirga sedimenti TaxID=2879465 RepID=A0A9X1KY02_9BACT|nr:bifunctional histidinol-phosphatase/imidazoleglycerol-phosphate dehydratase HisB [Fulvivirga sedimenti]MCA6075173.1 bifunctional histidinol-phosphatase/imidazoleglycerol-phosphate dehydratase HisB [Fulvivirga sedimenti]MCA6076350.1 bifunctional histidinol-phosphatase/imidazoleglycerol-phosphate dehydratase HisB [Fulvivirga sedimenti]MCA6077478.1 bifunctional histidinol-phosphatase/imidazoleglycerol-phosphate dehydratase HisB [Fulvivirga sedimenti]